MKCFQAILPLLAVAVLTVILVSCAQMKAIYNLPESHPEALVVGQQVNCAECHADEQKGTMKVMDAFSHSRSFVRNHHLYAATDDRLCSTCHKSSFCTDCHTNKGEMKPSTKYGNRPDREMPHRGNFLTIHKIEGKLDPSSCYRCHGRSNNELCSACHR